MKSDNFHRKGFKDAREGVEAAMNRQYQSEIVKTLKESNYLLEKDGVKVYLAKVRVPPRLPPPPLSLSLSLTHSLSPVLAGFLNTQLTHKLLTLNPPQGFWFLLGCGTEHCIGIRSSGTFPKQKSTHYQ